MLALTRKPGQSITITTPSGEKIIVTYIKPRGSGHAVAIGISAPREFKVLRSEVPDDDYSYVRQPEEATHD